MTLSLLSIVLAGMAGCARGGDLPQAPGTSSPTDGTSTYGTNDTASTYPKSYTEPPEEPEDVFVVRPPAQTDAYVFIANPLRNTVTRVNVSTFRVDTVTVGVDPQIVLTTPDYTAAVVFNRGEDSVTLLDTDTLISRTVPVRANHNDLVLSPDGRFAVTWHNEAREQTDDPIPEGLQSFNEVSFVEVGSGAHFPMAVGFNPRGVRFTPDGDLAVVVADAYLATVDLTVGDLAPRLVELAPDELAPPTAEEVIVAADGSFAWVRQFGAEELLVVDLVDRTVDVVPAGVNPTDLDLSHDGTQAIAVARGSEELWVYEADNPFATPTVLPLPKGAPYGSLLIDPSGDQGILYTSASLVEQYAVWDRSTGEIRERTLRKPVAGMAINPTGGTLLVFHTEEDGPETDPLFMGSWALTLVDLFDLRTNPLRLPAEPIAYSNGTDGTWGFFIMDGQPYLEVLDYSTLLHTEYALRSIPEFLGVLPDLTPGDGDAPAAWVSQEHPLGRLSFYDPDDNTLETLTGFELNSEIDGW